MQYKALISFSGLISMAEGEVREIEDPAIVNDLLKAGYIQPNIELPAQRVDQKLVDNQPKAVKEAVKKEEVKKTKKGGKKKNEN